MTYYFGSPGWEYMELGRFFQDVLLAGFVLWIVIMFRGVWPFLTWKRVWSPPAWLFYGSIIMVAFLFFSLKVIPKTNFIVSDFWRWMVVHMRVEVTFEVFTTVIVSYLLVEMGLATRKMAEKTTYIAVLLFFLTATIGIDHNFYWIPKPTGVIALAVPEEQIAVGTAEEVEQSQQTAALEEQMRKISFQVQEQGEQMRKMSKIFEEQQDSWEEKWVKMAEKMEESIEKKVKQKLKQEKARIVNHQFEEDEKQMSKPSDKTSTLMGEIWLESFGQDEAGLKRAMRRWRDAATRTDSPNGVGVPNGVGAAPSPIWNCKEIVLTAVKFNGKLLEFASDKLKNDEDIVEAAVKQNRDAFLFASPELKGVGLKKESLTFMAERILGGNNEILGGKSGNQWKAFEHASEDLRGDREFLVKVFLPKSQGQGLDYIAKALRDGKGFLNDKQVVIAAAKGGAEEVNMHTKARGNKYAYQEASTKLRADAHVQEIFQRLYPKHYGDIAGEFKACIGPGNYAEALTTLGGQRKLETFRRESEEINKKYSVGNQISQLLPARWNDRQAYSIVNNYQNYANSLKELMYRHRNIFPAFRKKMEKLAKDTAGDAIIPALKGKDRAKAKAIFKYSDTKGKVAWYRLTDIARATLLYDSLEKMYRALSKLDTHPDFEIVEFNDRYFAPMSGGYRDLQLGVRFKASSDPKGDCICEIQLNTEQMVYVKQHFGHRTFEVLRELRAAVDAGDAPRCLKILNWGKENLSSRAEEELQDLINEKIMTDSSDKRDNFTTLLHQAAAQGDGDVVARLLEFTNVDQEDAFGGANVRDSEERTPLHLALDGGHEQPVWALLNLGKADPTLQDGGGVSPLVAGFIMLETIALSDKTRETRTRCVSLLAQVACVRAGVFNLEQAERRAAEIVRSRYKDDARLVGAARDGNVKYVQELLLEGANPDSWEKEGTSALQMAINMNHWEVCKVLIDRRATVTRETLPKLKKMFSDVTGEEDHAIFQLDPENLLSDRDFVIQIVQQNWRKLQLAPPQLRNDRIVVAAAVRANAAAFQYASDDLKGNGKFVMEVAKRDGSALQYASKELQGNKEFVVEVAEEAARLKVAKEKAIILILIYSSFLLRNLGRMVRYNSKIITIQCKNFTLQCNNTLDS